MISPTIVVVGYNRPEALARLLVSIRKASYPSQSVRLHISIDRAEDGSSDAVAEIARSFQWDFGEKRLVYQPYPLGLVKHIYSCGDLALEYGSVILLEDDLAVSAPFYAFATQALEAYAGEPRLAGISLYGLWFNGYNQYPFVPLSDEADVFFLQIPYFQGQAFTGEQWSHFNAWNVGPNQRVQPSDPLHELFLHFDEQEWFPVRTKYLVNTGRYYVFPRQSLATGFGDPGTHFSSPTRFFQAPLQRFKDTYRFKPFEDSVAVYDSFYELLPDRLQRLTSDFDGFSFDMDLNGSKSPRVLASNPRTEYVLTSRPIRTPLKSYGKIMWPMEANVIDSVPGREIFFGRKAELNFSRWGDLAIEQSHYAYFSRGRPLPKKLLVKLILFRLIRSIIKP